MEITLRTLTPLWTGGVDQSCDRLHESGLIGSLRWWYEALVRGLGGYACDPKVMGHCEYDPKKKEPPEKQLCAACYLFGCTGWARLFRLQAEVDATVQLHFYTTLPANKRWLGSIFGGEKRNNGMTVPFGNVRLNLITRGQDDDYALGQLAWVVKFAATFGGLGAKLQHGFGQVALLTSLDQYSATAEQRLKERAFKFGKNDPTYPDQQRFFSESYSIAAQNPVLQAILAEDLIGTRPDAANFIPCAFDLRYKGGQIDGKQLGFRQWLLAKGWDRKRTNALLGETRARRDEERLGSRICFGMPWRNSQQQYVLRVFGFIPSDMNAKEIQKQLKAYLDGLFSEKGEQ